MLECPAWACGSRARQASIGSLRDDANGRAIEVIAVEGDKHDVIVIHAMPLREKYLAQYEEAMQWRL